MNEKSSCPYIKACAFLKKYNPEKTDLYHGWIKSFCEDIDKSVDCKIKQYHDEYDTMPPADMTPTGEILKDE